MSSNNKKLIAVIGGTGAQGMAVIAALASGPDPYPVRVLTRNPDHARAQELVSKYGVELVKGSVLDAGAVAKLFQGAYGAFVNTDTFEIGEIAELHAGVRAYELARHAGVKHFVYSSLDYKLKESGYDDRYNAPHYSAKGRIWEFIKSQAQGVDAGEMVCSELITGPYMESLNTPYGPIGQRQSDGAVVFALPWGAPGSDARFPLVALADVAFFARWLFAHPPSAAERVSEAAIVSQFISGTELAQTFERVTGKRAVYAPLSHEEFISALGPLQHAPLAREEPAGKTMGEFFRTSLRIWTEPGQIVRDMEWIKRVHPGTLSVEQWMRQTGYDGKEKRNYLKRFEGVPESSGRGDGLAHLLA